MAWGASAVGGGSVSTAGAAAAECVIGGRKESDKSSRANSAGNQGFGVGRKVSVGISVKRGAGIVRVGAVKVAVGKRADTAKMVEGGRKEKHILVNKRLENGRVGRGRATPELLPRLGKVIRASSGNRYKRCITLIRGRRQDGHIDKNSIVGRGRSRVAVVMRVKLEAYYVGRAGVGGGGNEILLWFVGDGITGGDEAGKGTEFAADCS
jgi:hypothetical protein